MALHSKFLQYAGVQRLALETLRSKIRTATSSMTSLPRPLKFLRPAYSSLKENFEKVTDIENRVQFFFNVFFFALFANSRSCRKFSRISSPCWR